MALTVVTGRRDGCRIFGQLAGILARLLTLSAAGYCASALDAETVAVTFGRMPIVAAPGLASVELNGADLPPMLGHVSLKQFQAFASQVLGMSPTGYAAPINRDNLFLADGELLHPWIHLARERGLEPEVYEIQRWRIIAAVLDHGEQVATNSNSSTRNESEVRLVAQPLTYRATGLVSHDYAMHLTYVVHDVEGFFRDIASWKGLKAAPENNSRQQERFTWASDVLNRYATEENLIRIAWSTSSRSGQQWSFGSLVRESDNAWRLAELPGGGYFDNFSKSEMLRGRGGINHEQNATLSAAFGSKTAAHLIQSATKEIARLQDPGSSRRSEGLCVACHMADQLAVLRSHQGGIFNANGVTVFGTTGVKLGNQRQIGFRYDGEFWLSSRMIRTLSDARP